MPRCVSRILGCGVRVAFLASRVGGARVGVAGSVRFVVARLLGARVWVCPCVCGREKREEGTCLVGSLLSLLLFCGANDGTRTRCLHLGRVTLSLLSFIRSVFPRLLACVCLRLLWGFGADDGT